MDTLGPIIFIIAIAGALVVGILYIASIIWAYRDAERRGKEGILVALLVALVAWPFSLVIWLVIRPDSYR